MTVLVNLEIEDPHDPRLARGADGLLRTFNEAGVLDASDVHVAQRLCALAEEDEPLVALAVAFAVRAVRGGSVCVDLAAVAERRAIDLPWPRPGRMARRRRRQRAGHLGHTRSCGCSRRTTSTCSTSTATGARRSRCTPTWSAGPRGSRRPRTRPGWPAALDRVFPARATTSSAPRPASRSPSRRPSSPADPAPARPRRSPRCSRCCAEQAELAGEPPLRIALAAPTGKAAARLQQAVEDEVAEAARRRPAPGSAGVRAVTLHRLLGCAARHVLPVPSPPRQPAPARRGRGRRDLDGLADDDGAAARGGPRRQPADPGGRPVPAHLGRGRRRAGATWSRPCTSGTDGSASLRCVTSHRFGEYDRGARRRRVRAGDADAAIELLEAGGEHIECVDGDRTRRPRCARWSLPHAARACSRAAEAGDAERRARGCWTASGCCARTARAPTASATGTGRSSAGSARRPASRSGRPVVRRPAPAGHRQRLRRSASTTATTGVAVRPPGQRRRALRAAVAGSTGGSTSPPAGSTPGRDDARADDPQEPGQPGRGGRSWCCRRRSRGC